MIQSTNSKLKETIGISGKWQAAPKPAHRSSNQCQKELLLHYALAVESGLAEVAEAVVLACSQSLAGHQMTLLHHPMNSTHKSKSVEKRGKSGVRLELQQNYGGRNGLSCTCRLGQNYSS